MFSGGIDSTTALYWARDRFSQMHALVFDYGQRHRVEVDMARITAEKAGVECFVASLSMMGLATSALVGDQGDIPSTLAAAKDGVGLPSTYVPFRNGVFLSLAASYGESRRIFDLITGFNMIDTPDYPDTTGDFTRAMETAINYGTSAALNGPRFHIHTPLLEKNKAEILRMGLKLEADYSHSVSCYRGDEVPCGNCPSCEIRARAFAEINMEDPLVIRLRKEGRL